MKSIVEFLEVYVDEEGDVCLAQRDMSEDCYIAFPPEEVDALIRLLRAKKREAVQFRQREHAVAH